MPTPVEEIGGGKRKMTVQKLRCYTEADSEDERAWEINRRAIGILDAWR
jgi:hypothetical protein